MYSSMEYSISHVKPMWMTILVIIFCYRPIIRYVVIVMMTFANKSTTLPITKTLSTYSTSDQNESYWTPNNTNNPLNPKRNPPNSIVTATKMMRDNAM